VRNAAGRIVAALTAAFAGDPPDADARARFAKSVIAAADEISARLGHRS
jgi:DNA-binding IclR family transcriptional regulator